MNIEFYRIRLSCELLEHAGFKIKVVGKRVYAKHGKMPPLRMVDDVEDNEFYLKFRSKSVAKNFSEPIWYFHELKKAYFHYTGRILTVTL